MKIDRKRNNRIKLLTFSTSIGKPTTMILFLASTTIKIGKRNIKHKEQRKKRFMVKIMKKNFHLHMCKDRNM